MMSELGKTWLAHKMVFLHEKLFILSSLKLL
jgi:hypothetical protein